MDSSLNLTKDKSLVAMGHGETSDTTKNLLTTKKKASKPAYL